MRHVTSDTVQQDNETYRRFLEPNSWTLKAGDYLMNSFTSGTTTGTMTAKEKMPQLTNESAIYAVVPELPNIGRLDLASNNGWHVNKTQLRVLGETPLIIKANTSSSYGPVRLFGPKEFMCDFKNAQQNIGFIVDGQGLLGQHLIMFSTAKNGKWRLAGFRSGGGGFTGLRLFEPGSDTDTSRVDTTEGELTNFYIHNTISEGIYMGSIKKYHTRFINTHIHQGFLINTGSEAGQFQNIGTGSVIENITVVNTGCEFPSPFQANQVGMFQIKAGGGNFIVRNIYAENSGQPVINFFASLPVYGSNGQLVQEGCRPGEIYTIENIYSPKQKGNFLYVHSSCCSGAEWVMDKIYTGGVTKRIGQDTQEGMPYAFLYDVPSQVTDKLTIKSITYDNTLPLTGKGGQKYNILSKTVGEIPFAKFVKPQPCTELLSFYNVYNEVSQSQFYPVAGQPVKFRKGDITFDNIAHSPTRWMNVIADGTSQDDIFEDTVWDINPFQTPDSPLYNVCGVVQEEDPDGGGGECECEDCVPQEEYDELLAEYNQTLEQLHQTEDILEETETELKETEDKLDQSEAENVALQTKIDQAITVLSAE